MGPRVRFAPSPTGFLHIGGARTALYNWLLARHEDGTFILRIEDTDRARSTGEYLDAIVEDLRWLGLDWDEGPEVGGSAGPYFQSERTETYAPRIESLLDAGFAYRCYCSPEDLEERRSRAPSEGKEWRYDGRCRSLSESEREKLESEGRPSVIRFRVPDGSTAFDDMILGPVEVENAELDDLVIARSDGTPTYNFVVVVDDLEMGITHVVRGSDHLSNTPKQILIFRALGHEPPAYGHLPLVLAPDRQVLSKRRGAVAIGEYRRRGYVPEALVNAMALLGWSYDDSQEFFTLEELVRLFDVSKVSRKAAAFDDDKLAWMNAQWIRRLSVRERTERLIPRLTASGLLREDAAAARRDWLESVVEAVGDRLKTLDDFEKYAGFFLAEDVEYANIAVSEVLAKPGVEEILAGLCGVFEDAPGFDVETLEVLVREYAEAAGVKLGKIVQPLRVAVTGDRVSPGIFETLSLLGRDTVLDRIERARHLAHE